MSEQVLIGIASIPERKRSLARVLAALSPQADRIEVSLNGYDRVPEFIRPNGNVFPTLRGEEGGDSEKFAAVDDWDGVVLTCDDDILYPPDYVADVVAGLERWPGRAVSYHAGTTLGWNGQYVAASGKRIRCLGDQPEDDPDVNVLGTGTLGFRTRDVPVWREFFRHPNMADVWFALLGQQFGVKMAALRHRERWLQDICPPVGYGRRIYDSNRNQDGTLLDTTVMRERVARSRGWVVDPPRPRVHVSVATCERPDLMLELLGDLAREAQWVDLSVSVFEDPSTADYGAARRFSLERGWSWRTFRRRLGRARHWELVDAEFATAKTRAADFFVFMPDDVRLVRHAIPRAIATWHQLEAPASLTLWRLGSLEGRSNWTGQRPVQRDGATEIFHLDGFYLCGRETLERLSWRCGRVRMTPTGSGVGASLSRRLHQSGARMFRVDRSLGVCNDGGRSVMNAEERELHPAVAL